MRIICSNFLLLVYFVLLLAGMAYNFQKYNLDRIQYLGAPYDTGYEAQHVVYIYIYFFSLLHRLCVVVFLIFLPCSVIPLGSQIPIGEPCQSILKCKTTAFISRCTGSVMHYDAFAFAKNRERPTIIAKKSGTELGQRRGFSDVCSKLTKID